MRGLLRPNANILPVLRLRAVVAVAVAMLVALVAAPSGTRAQDLDEARRVVATVADVGVTQVVGADLPQAEKISRFRDLFTTYFDVPSIGRFVLGHNWRPAPPEEQERFLELFQEVNVFTWARRFGDYDGQALTIGGATADGPGGAFVDSVVEQTGGQPPIRVQWRLRQRDEGFKVVDLIIEGVSMAITYRQEYNAVIQQAGSLAALNDRLAAQLARLKAEQGL